MYGDYEYKLIYGSTSSEFEDALNDAVKAGWDITEMTFHVNELNDGRKSYYVIAKRYKK